MQEIEQAIIELFRAHPHTEFSTTEIVERITPDYNQTRQDIRNKDDIERCKAAKEHKGYLHRKYLYHLNKLVRKGSLTVKRIGKNKERVFAALQGLQELHTLPVIARLHSPLLTPAVGIEGLEQQGIIARLDPITWAERVNSILLESTYFKTLKDLTSTTINMLGSVNDAIALNDFEHVIQNNKIQTVVEALKALNKAADAHARHISLIIDLTNVQNSAAVLRVVEDVLHARLRNLTFIYDVQIKEFQANNDFFRSLIDLYSKEFQSLFIKNQTLHQAPYMIGRAGPYTFAEQDWKAYHDEFQGKMPGLVCGTATFLIDIERLFQNTPEHQINAVIELMCKIAKSLLLTNAEQRERSEHFLRNLIELSPAHAQNFFLFSHNYVRFWNYGWKTNHYDQDFVIKYLSESKKAANEYCISEETIYKSCGMPTRFRISYSCTDQESAQKIFSTANYRRVTVHGVTEFFKNNEMAQTISTKQEIFRHFDGGDRITFDRPEPKKAEDAVNEINHILSTFRLPFFRYNFTHQTEIPLTRFL